VDRCHVMRLVRSGDLFRGLYGQSRGRANSRNDGGGGGGGGGGKKKGEKKKTAP